MESPRPTRPPRRRIQRTIDLVEPADGTYTFNLSINAMCEREAAYFRRDDPFVSRTYFDLWTQRMPRHNDLVRVSLHLIRITRVYPRLYFGVEQDRVEIVGAIERCERTPEDEHAYWKSKESCRLPAFVFPHAAAVVYGDRRRVGERGPRRPARAPVSHVSGSSSRAHARACRLYGRFGERLVF